MKQHFFKTFSRTILFSCNVFLFVFLPYLLHLYLFLRTFPMKISLSFLLSFHPITFMFSALIIIIFPLPYLRLSHAPISLFLVVTFFSISFIALFISLPILNPPSLFHALPLSLHAQFSFLNSFKLTQPSHRPFLHLLTHLVPIHTPSQHHYLFQNIPPPNLHSLFLSLSCHSLINSPKVFYLFHQNHSHSVLSSTPPRTSYSTSATAATQSIRDVLLPGK